MRSLRKTSTYHRNFMMQANDIIDIECVIMCGGRVENTDSDPARNTKVSFVQSAVGALSISICSAEIVLNLCLL